MASMTVRGATWPTAFDSDEYVPDLGTNPATVQMCDSYFVGTEAALLKTRIEDAAQRVGLNPGGIDPAGAGDSLLLTR
jgi:hypothetical protein